MLRHRRRLLYAALIWAGVVLVGLVNSPAIAQITHPVATTARPYQHVLLLSVDGLRQADLIDPALQSSLPNLKQLAQTGVSYTNAYTSSPSDSFPGILNYLTGAGPKTTGVYYDDSYDRQLIAPGGAASSPKGSEIAYDESIDKDTTLLSGGGNFSTGSLDPAKLPLNCQGQTCTPVYPHSYLKVNTIFEVARAAGLHTAYSDKHPAYDLVNGPSGQGVVDLYTPEINAKVALQNGKLVDASTAENPTSLTFKSATKRVDTTEAYDDLKVNAILNQIKGMNALATARPGVPALFGMNFQAVSVAQKDRAVGGIAADGTPSEQMKHALSHTDASIGRMVAALKQQNLLNSTLMVVTAKHGQSPRLGEATLIANTLISDALQAAGVKVAHSIQDDVGLFWLKDANQTAKASQVLEQLKRSNPATPIDQVLSGGRLLQAGLTTRDRNSRTPDLLVLFRSGVVAVDDPSDSNKRAEHGGFSEDDTHVALIVSGGLPDRLHGIQRRDRVSTTQIAVTALESLGLNPNDLQGAKAEGTRALPGLEMAMNRRA
ncbi:MAG TPA: alkaline phosphatase family protein [Coleofasciculaceae cyanobacterium]